jgi:3-dehydroquinate synthase
VQNFSAAEKNGECEKGTAQKITQALHNCNLPATTGIDLKKLAELAKNDKKRRGEFIKIVLPKSIGNCIVKTVKSDELADYLGGKD